MDTDTENVSNKSQAAIEDYLSCFQTFLLTADKYGCRKQHRRTQRSALTGTSLFSCDCHASTVVSNNVAFNDGMIDLPNSSCPPIYTHTDTSRDTLA